MNIYLFVIRTQKKKNQLKTSRVVEPFGAAGLVKADLLRHLVGPDDVLVVANESPPLDVAACPARIAGGSLIPGEARVTVVSTEQKSVKVELGVDLAVGAIG